MLSEVHGLQCKEQEKVNDLLPVALQEMYLCPGITYIITMSTKKVHYY